MSYDDGSVAHNQLENAQADLELHCLHMINLAFCTVMVKQVVKLLVYFFFIFLCMQLAKEMINQPWYYLVQNLSSRFTLPSRSYS